MKLSFLMFIFLIVLTSCNVEHGNGTNVYDPKNINIGDKIQNFILTDIVVIPATADYPIDTVSATFEGKVKLTGTMELIKADGDFTKENLLLFTPDQTSQQKLPISHHEEQFGGLVFTNQADAINMLNITPGETLQKITISIQNYTNNFLATDAMNMTTLLKVHH